MVNYKELYFYLVGQVDDAITLLEKNPADLLSGQRAAALLKETLLAAEDLYLNQTEEK